MFGKHCHSLLGVLVYFNQVLVQTAMQSKHVKVKEKTPQQFMSAYK